MITTERARPRALLITDATQPGGVGTHVGQLALTGRRSGWDVSVLMEEVPATDGMANTLRDLGVSVKRAGLYRKQHSEEQISDSVLSVINELRPDVVHVHCGSPRSGVMPRKLTLDASVPLIVTEHYVAPDLEITEEQLQSIRPIYKNAYAVIAVCDENRRLLQQKFGLHAKRQMVIRNGVTMPAKKYRPDASLVNFRSVSIARLAHQKGIDVLIRAVAALPEEIHERATFTVAGDGEDEAQLKKLAGNLGVSECFDFVGWSNNVPALLATHDLFILPSRAEGQPIALMEALAAGLPCIATAVSGIPEVLAGGAFGALVPPDDPESLCAAIASFAREPGILQRKVRDSRRHIEMNYDVDRNMSKVVGVWKAATVSP